MGDGGDLSAGGASPGSVETVSWNRPAISPLTPPRTISENPCSPQTCPSTNCARFVKGQGCLGVAPRLRVHCVRRSVPPVCTALQAWLWTRGELRMGTRTAEPLGVVITGSPSRELGEDAGRPGRQGMGLRAHPAAALWMREP